MTPSGSASRHPSHVRIREVGPEEAAGSALRSSYRTRAHYAVSLESRAGGWTVRLRLRDLPRPLTKAYRGRLFEPHVERPRAFVASVGGIDVGWIEVGHETWNNRVRVWELLVAAKHRRQGIGRALIARALEVAREVDARAVVLETQSCNVAAIRFYRAEGFELVGFDRLAYTNRDVERGEVRLEFARPLPSTRTVRPGGAGRGPRGGVNLV